MYKRQEQRLQVIRQCDERMMEVREARRGYVQGSAWDEGNMIQAMARLPPKPVPGVARTIKMASIDGQGGIVGGG